MVIIMAATQQRMKPKRGMSSFIKFAILVIVLLSLFFLFFDYFRALPASIWSMPSINLMDKVVKMPQTRAAPPKLATK